MEKYAKISLKQIIKSEQNLSDDLYLYIKSYSLKEKESNFLDILILSDPFNCANLKFNSQNYSHEIL